MSGDQARATGDGWSGLVARWNGAWTVLPPITGLRLSIGDLHPAGPDDVWAVGTEAGIGGPPGRPGNPVLAHWDGTAWTRVQPGFTVGSLTGIAADAEGRAAWISGWNFQDQTRSTYLRRDGDAWTVVRGPAGTATAPYLNDVTPIPGTAGFWSAGMTSPTPAPPTEAYTERLDARWPPRRVRGGPAMGEQRLLGRGEGRGGDWRRRAFSTRCLPGPGAGTAGKG